MAARLCPMCQSPRHEVVLRPTIGSGLRVNRAYDDILERFDLDRVVPIVRCEHCEFVFVGELVEESLIERAYGSGDSENAADKELSVAHTDADTRQWLKLLHMASRVDERKVTEYRVLDFGCGSGRFLSIAQATGVHAVGFDPYPRASTPSHIVTSAEELRESGTFDIFRCNQVMEHTVEPRAEIALLRSVLASDAVGVISVPDFTRHNWDAEQANLDRTGNVTTKNINVLEHLNYFDQRHLMQLVHDAGLDRVMPRSSNPWEQARSTGQWLLGAIGLKERTTVYVRVRSGSHSP